MKLVYLSTARMPDEWAHVIQILKTCEAFAAEGVEVELVVPRRGNTPATDPFAYAGVRPTFVITRLPCVDLNPGTQGKFLYFLRTYSFLICARFYLWFSSFDALYVREPLVADFFPSAVLELHTITPALRARMRSFKGRRIVTISAGLKADVQASGIPAESICIAPDGVDLEQFAHPESREAARARLGLPAEAKIALYIGLLDAWKGTGTLYAAAKSLSPEVVVAVIGGSAEELPALRAAHPDVRFLGFHPYSELPDNQQAADVLVLPNSGKETISSKYTSPLKLFSYMASGKPIVASDLPSIREVLDDDAAYLVMSDDAAALANGIREALGHTDAAAARAARAAETVQTYTWRERARKILAFIQPQRLATD